MFLVPFPDQPFVGLNEEFSGRFFQRLPPDDVPYFLSGNHELLGNLPVADVVPPRKAGGFAGSSLIPWFPPEVP